MTTSRVPAVIGYLVATFTASATLGQAVPPVAIFDGWPVTEDPAQLALFVGTEDPDAAAPSAATSTQAWAGLGHQARNESLSVHCTAQAWTGEPDIAKMRTAAYAILAAVEDIVRNDSTLGGTVTVPGNAAVTSAELRQASGDGKAMARVTFTIDAQARIGG